ncbi:hypothetical protein [Ferruginibacter profundus]
MRKYLFIIIGSLSFSIATAQKSLGKFIDSAIKITSFSADDWAIGLDIRQAGRMAIYDTHGNDSLGNEFIDPAMDCILFIIKIQGKYYTQKFTTTYELYTHDYHTSIQKALPAKITIDYNIDSLRLSGKEYILPFIYKLDGVEGYSYQQPADHSQYYTMYFKTKELDVQTFFNEDDIREAMSFLKPGEKNVNYLYNSKTFTLRAFYKLRDLFNEHKEIFLFK